MCCLAGELSCLHLPRDTTRTPCMSEAQTRFICPGEDMRACIQIKDDLDNTSTYRASSRRCAKSGRRHHSSRPLLFRRNYGPILSSPPTSPGWPRICKRHAVCNDVEYSFQRQQEEFLGMFELLPFHSIISNLNQLNMKVRIRVRPHIPVAILLTTKSTLITILLSMVSHLQMINDASY
jgi:hypothetical protein